MIIEESKISLTANSKHTIIQQQEITVHTWTNKRSTFMDLLIAEYTLLDPGGKNKLNKSQQMIQIKALLDMLFLSTIKPLSARNHIINNKLKELIQNLINSNTGHSGSDSSGGMEVILKQSVTEKESLNLTASGTIKTADGYEFNFSLNLNLNRTFNQSSMTNIQTGDVREIDPLVISFDGSATQLVNTTFTFDLDNDGTEETLNNLSEGSGFIAFDKNGDGIINNGSELFGPTTGNGFNELQEYDKDKNGWIDEADAIYKELLIWTPQDGAETDNLQSLKEADVGAIFLGNVNAPFTFADSENNTKALSTRGGFYIKESHHAPGSILQIDYLV